MYAIKNEEEDRLFMEKSARIKQMKPQEIMGYLGINQKFIICEHLNFTSRTTFSNMDQSKYQGLNRDSLGVQGNLTDSHKEINETNNFESQRTDSPNKLN
mmetsp:Transcript_25770/g.25060  ORF Transcript_25770/g.25060 Transcript_25770/m.25060 type:complete len:100 (-) Transcript_25770:407-706(-)